MGDPAGIHRNARGTHCRAQNICTFMQDPVIFAILHPPAPGDNDLGLGQLHGAGGILLNGFNR